MCHISSKKCYFFEKQLGFRFGRAKVSFLEIKKEAGLKIFSRSLSGTKLVIASGVISSLFFDFKTCYFCGLFG